MARPPACGGLRFERHQQVHHGAHAGAAVGEVAGLDEDGGATNQRRPASSSSAFWRMTTNGSSAP